MKKINPIDNELIRTNLSFFLKSIMKKFPTRFESFLDLLASPERPVFVMTKDTARFAALELTVSHLGVMELVIEVVKEKPVLFDDMPIMLWIKITDPEQFVDEYLMIHHEIAFNDIERNERYFTTDSTIVNLVYSKSGTGIVTIFPRTSQGVERYKQNSGIDLPKFVNSMLEGLQCD